MDGLRETETQTSSRTSEFSHEQQTRQFARDDETWTLDPPATESVSTEWTDEKHRMYLESMEATFVDQLYNSLDFLGRCSPKKKSSDITLSKQTHRTPSGQYKVLRSGCWQKINFERPDSQLKKTRDPSGLLASPWIRHFKSPCKAQTLASPSPSGISELKSRAINSSGKKVVSCGSASTECFAACHCHSCNRDLVGSNTEVSDQNFTDEEIKSEKTSNMCSSKKMKTQMGDASSHDQVVPHSKSPETGNGAEKCDFAAR